MVLRWSVFTGHAKSRPHPSRSLWPLFLLSDLLSSCCFSFTPPQSAPIGASGAWLGVVETPTPCGSMSSVSLYLPSSCTQQKASRVPLMLLPPSSLSLCQAVNAQHDEERLLDGHAPASFCSPIIGLETGQQKKSPDVCWEV